MTLRINKFYFLCIVWIVVLSGLLVSDVGKVTQAHIIELSSAIGVIVIIVLSMCLGYYAGHVDGYDERDRM